MTAPAAAAPRPLAGVEPAVDLLRERGLRASAARRLLLEALFAADGPVTAEALAAGLAGRLPASDLTSVYRNLETLEALGIVSHVHLGHGPGLYGLASGDRGYLVCESCGEARELEGEPLRSLRAAVRASSGFEAGFRHFPIVGLCPSCRRAGPYPAGSRG